MTNRRGFLLILSSPSGAGKSTLTKRLLADDDGFDFSVSATTRPPRPGEVDGKDYHFKTRAQFDQMVEADEMLEYATVFEKSYGTPRAPVEAALAAGRDMIFDIDWQGGQQINEKLPNDVVSIFILPPSIAALEARLNGRGQDSAEVVAHRMARSYDEISHWAEYQYVLVNDDLDKCYEELRSILRVERLKRERPALAGFVRGLNQEFEGYKK